MYLWPNDMTVFVSLCLQAHLVAAFEKSLSNMTCRLQSLTMTAEQKVLNVKYTEYKLHSEGIIGRRND